MLQKTLHSAIIARADFRVVMVNGLCLLPARGVHEQKTNQPQLLLLHEQFQLFKWKLYLPPPEQPGPVAAAEHDLHCAGTR